MEWLVWLAIIIAPIVYWAKQSERALQKARVSYEAALNALEKEPENNQLRKAALEQGRAYAELARKQAGDKSVALFDEVALTNDLTARPAAVYRQPRHIGQAGRRLIPRSVRIVPKKFALLPENADSAAMNSISISNSSSFVEFSFAACDLPQY